MYFVRNDDGNLKALTDGEVHALIVSDKLYDLIDSGKVIKYDGPADNLIDDGEDVYPRK